MLTGLGASLGIGSGIDMNKMLSGLMTMEARPLQQLTVQQGRETAKLSAYGQVKGALGEFSAAISALKDPKGKTIDVVKTKVDEGAGYSASATDEAVNGTYDIQITQVAKAHRAISDAGTQISIGAGTTPSVMTIEFGSLSADKQSFIASKNTKIEFKGETLEELRDAINDSNSGVRASIINNGTSKQMVFSSGVEGEEGMFRINGEDRLNEFKYSPVVGGTSSGSITTLQQAQGAKAKIDGIEVSSKTNKFEGVIDGLTITAEKVSVNDESKPLTISRDNSALSKALDELLKAYNNAVKVIDDLSKVDTSRADKPEASLLTGDSTLRSIRSALEDAMFGAYKVEGSNVTSLSQLGIYSTPRSKDGKPNIDSEAKMNFSSSDLMRAMSNEKLDVVAFFTGADGKPGFGDQLSSRIDALLEKGSGVLDQTISGVNKSLEIMDKEKMRLEEKLAATEQRYVQQFSTLDTLVAKMSQMNTALLQQLSSLPQISKK